MLALTLFTFVKWFARLVEPGISGYSYVVIFFPQNLGKGMLVEPQVYQ